MISVIIPTLDEAHNLPCLLEALAAEPTPHEVIVSDGGSGDDSCAIARSSGVRLIEGPAARGAQLRRGADEAAGDTFFFLHADCQIAPGTLAAIERCLARSPDLIGGNFALLFDGDDGFSEWLNGFYAWFREKGLYYGDSGVFIRRRAYDELGGIPDWPLMEDFRFTRLMERHRRAGRGDTICIADPPLITSSRRFSNKSPAYIFWHWCLIHGLYYAKFPTAKLAEWYYHDRAKWWAAK